MSDTVRWNSGQPGRPEPRGNDGANLADILERVLDKGIVIAGDIQVNLLDIELLTIKIRLVVASVDRAKEMGIDWWERDPTLSAGRQELEDENDELRSRIAALEAAISGDPAPREVTDEQDADEQDTDEADLDEAGLDEADPEPDADPEADPEPDDDAGGADRPRRRRGAGTPRRRAPAADRDGRPAERPVPRRGGSRER